MNRRNESMDTDTSTQTHNVRSETDEDADGAAGVGPTWRCRWHDTHRHDVDSDGGSGIVAGPPSNSRNPIKCIMFPDASPP